MMVNNCLTYFISFMKILVSACLAGINCNFKGESKPTKLIIDLIKQGRAIPICPEQLGGLITPRSGARIISGKGEDVIENKSLVITDLGEDVTKQYLLGAKEALRLVKEFDVKLVILKQGSPSCGKGKTVGGEKERSVFHNNGVTVALLEKNGIKVITEKDIDDKLLSELIK